MVFEIYDALEARERGSKRERLNAWVILIDPGQIEIVLLDRRYVILLTNWFFVLIWVGAKEKFRTTPGAFGNG